MNINNDCFVLFLAISPCLSPLSSNAVYLIHHKHFQSLVQYCITTCTTNVITWYNISLNLLLSVPFSRPVVRLHPVWVCGCGGKTGRGGQHPLPGSQGSPGQAQPGLPHTIHSPPDRLLSGSLALALTEICWFWLNLDLIEITHTCRLVADWTTLDCSQNTSWIALSAMLYTPAA